MDGESVLSLESLSNIGVPGAFLFRVDQNLIMPPPRVILTLLNDTATVMEPDSGETIGVTFCFTARIQEPLSFQAFFRDVPNNASTALAGSDYLPNSIFIPETLPVGESFGCVSMTIIGDDEVEGDEVAVINYVPLVPGDIILFASGASSLNITIVNNDGKI